MKWLTRSSSKLTKERPNFPPHFDSVHPEVYKDPAFGPSPLPDRPLATPQPSSSTTQKRRRPTPAQKLDHADLSFQVDHPLSKHSLDSHPARYAAPQRDFGPYPIIPVHASPPLPQQPPDSRNAMNGKSLDSIDELDESSPQGFSLHHGGPYEAARRIVPVKSPSRSKEGVPVHPGAFVLNLSPGQVLPRDMSPLHPGQPPRNGSSQPPVPPAFQMTLSPLQTNGSRTPPDQSLSSNSPQTESRPPVPRQQPQGSSSTQPGPIPNNDRVPIPANFFPRHSFPPGTMEPILPPREQALTASDTAPTNTSVRETVPAVDVTPPPPIPVKASGTGQNDAPAQASQTITVRNARPSLMPPTPTESIESASVYDPADLYGGIEDDQPAEPPSVNRQPSFQPKLPSVIESSVANQPAPFARNNMSVPALAKENIHSVSPSNHEARGLANPQSNPPPLPHNQSSSTIGSYTSSGHSTTTAQPPPYASHVNHSAPTRLGADYRPQNPHLPKHLVMPSPLQQQQQPSRQPQNVPPERRSSTMYYPHQQPLQPSLEPPLQPVLQPVMHRDDHRVRQSPSPHNMSRAQQIPIYEHPDVTSSSKKLLRKRSSVAGMPPPGSGKHASIPPNMPLDFSADIGLRQKVPTRSTSDKRPPPSTTGGQGTGKPLRRYLSKRRHES